MKKFLATPHYLTNPQRIHIASQAMGIPLASDGLKPRKTLADVAALYASIVDKSASERPGRRELRYRKRRPKTYQLLPDQDIK